MKLVDISTGETLFKAPSFFLPSPKSTGWRNKPDENAGILMKYVFAETEAGRKAWIKRLEKLGFNFFVSFRDVRSDFAIQATVHHLECTNGRIYPIYQ